MLKGKNDGTIVTGAARGIGKAIARRLAAEEMSVVVADIDDEQGAITAEEIRQEGHAALFVHADVTDVEQVEAMVETTVQEFGTVSMLVNNAGGLTAPGAGSEDLLEMSLETWDADLRLNLTSTFLTSKAVLSVMDTGLIVNVASVNGLLAIDSPAYSAAKAGMLALTRHVACCYGHRVRAVALALGTIGTETVLAHWERRRDSLKPLETWYPVRRIGRPEDVAEFVAFLSTAGGEFFNGATVVLDGGLCAGLPHFGKQIV